MKTFTRSANTKLKENAKNQDHQVDGKKATKYQNMHTTDDKSIELHTFYCACVCLRVFSLFFPLSELNMQ